MTKFKKKFDVRRKLLITKYHSAFEKVGGVNAFNSPLL